jgi:hypothetical protein
LTISILLIISTKFDFSVGECIKGFVLLWRAQYKQLWFWNVMPSFNTDPSSIDLNALNFIPKWGRASPNVNSMKIQRNSERTK